MTKAQETLQKHAAAALRAASDLTADGQREAAQLMIEAAAITNRAFDLLPKDAPNE